MTGHDDPKRNGIPADSALLVIDVQKDFCPGGALEVPQGDRVIPVLNRTIERFEGEGRPVYATRDWHPPNTTHFREFGGPWPPHCIAGTEGARFHPDLRVTGDTIVISKGQSREDEGYSMLDGTTDKGRELLDDLRDRGVSTLYVGGLATDYCVRASVLDALNAGFTVKVLTDGIAGIGAEDAARALEEMQQAGASLVSSREVRCELRD